jgi:hypothetical protein
MRLLRILALAGAVAVALPQAVFAQDGELGKKGGGKGGSKSGGSSSGGGKSGGSGSQSGGGKSGGSSSGSVASPPRSNGGGSGGTVIGPPRSGGSTQGGTGGLGRPERPGQDGSNRGDITVKRGGGDSRSGNVSYGTTSNVRALGKPEGSYTIGEVPRVSTSRGIALEAKGESRHVRTEVHDHRVGDDNYRFGYWHYQGNWCDDWFNYPYYQFHWDPYHCVPSPFYGYGHLPPYIQCVRVSIGSFSWTACNTRYAWVPAYHDNGYGYGWGRDRRMGELDYAVNDLARAFRERRMRLIDGYIGRSVIVEYGYGERYRMSGDDFYDMLRDAVEGTRTEDYLVQDVCRDGDRATVTAYHTFYNAWGIRESIRHIFGLVEARRGYEIEYFRTERF